MAYRDGPKTDIVIDIETVPLPVSPEEIEEYNKTLEPPANYKDPITILKWREAKMAGAIDALSDKKRFSIEGKRMISCAVGVADHDNHEMKNVTSWASDDLSVITTGLVQYLNQFDEMRLVGWNHQEFDVPEIIKSLAKTGMWIKRPFSKWDMVDLCKSPFRATKLKTTAKAFGLEVMNVNGGDVGKLHEEGNWELIQKYNEHDVILTGMLHLHTSRFWRQ